VFLGQRPFPSQPGATPQETDHSFCPSATGAAHRTGFTLADKVYAPVACRAVDTSKPATLFYKRSHFVTHLPVDYRYTRSHFWLARQPEGDGKWRIGLTKFATRMLGDMVDHGFESEAGAPVNLGDIVGWVEGFKAISDVYCVAQGTFVGGNPALREAISLMDKKPYTEGWLYAVQGTPDEKCLDVQGYREHLDRAIDLILSKQKNESA
jgi:glycine cleavage system H protein